MQLTFTEQLTVQAQRVASQCPTVKERGELEGDPQKTRQQRGEHQLDFSPLKGLDHSCAASAGLITPHTPRKVATVLPPQR